MVGSVIILISLLLFLFFIIMGSCFAISELIKEHNPASYGLAGLFLSFMLFFLGIAVSTVERLCK